MTTASAGSPKGQDPERGLIAEGDNIAVGVADAPTPIDLRLAYARVIDPEAWKIAEGYWKTAADWRGSQDATKSAKSRIGMARHYQSIGDDKVAPSLAKADAILALPNPTAYARIREALELALVERNVDRFNAVAFVHRHEIIEALKATHLIGLEGERGLDTVDTLAPSGIDREFLRQQIAADPDIETEARIGLSQGEGDLSARVRRLVIAARVVAYSDGQTDMTELDQAAEAFAADIPWENGDDA